MGFKHSQLDFEASVMVATYAHELYIVRTL